MYLEPFYRTNADGSMRGPYFRQVRFISGLRERSYVQRDMAHQLVGSMSLMQALKAKLVLPNYSQPRRSSGRPPKISRAMRAVYDAAGYQLRGNRVIERRDAVDDPSAMATRFALLAPDYQHLFGSWEEYADVLKAARRRLKSANRSRRRGYDLEHAFTDELEDRYS